MLYSEVKSFSNEGPQKEHSRPPLSQDDHRITNTNQPESFKCVWGEAYAPRTSTIRQARCADITLVPPHALATTTTTVDD